MTDPSFAHGLVGVTLDGRYRLDAVIGEGGMGSVFRATQLAMDRRVAVKLLKPHLTSDEAALQRFAREARATLKVSSPHAVKILDFGVTPERDYYMVLEYLDGRTVQRELEVDGPFAPTRVAHVARQALEALGVAHQQGLIHRDVKPDNLLLMRVGADPDYTKILDFGVAKLMQGAAGGPSQLALTAAGMVFGTPEFMSPEQACGQALDARSDLYSLAATMFVMLTGTTLFEARSAIEWLTHHAATPPPRLATARPELAAYPELDDLLQRCLAKHRDDRPASAGELARLLAELEPTLTRAPAAGPRAPTTRPNAIRPSSYVAALPGTALADARLASTMSQASLGALPRGARRRGWILGLGALAIAALIGLAVFASSRPPPSRSTSIPTSILAAGPAPSPAAGSAAAVQAAAPALDRAPVVTTTTEPAAAEPRVTRATTTTTTERDRPALARGRAAAAAQHLRAAETADNPLTQLIQANLALDADPRSFRARFLAGDALIKSGDLSRGCEQLRLIRAYRPARARARVAGCPND